MKKRSRSAPFFMVGRCQSASVSTTGAWSLGCGFLRGTRSMVQAVVRERNEVLAGLWKSRGTVLDAAGEAARLEPALRPVVGSILREVLQRLYPQAWTAAAAAPGTPSAVAADGAQSRP